MRELNDYYQEVFAALLKHPEWRYGQALYNVLAESHPELAKEVNATGLDPFYGNNLGPFLEFIQERLKP